MQTDILMRLAAHLEGLAGRVAALEDAVGQKFTAHSTPADDLITQLQSLDFIRQSLEDSALLSLALHNHSTTFGLSEADINGLAQKLRLESTRALLHVPDAPISHAPREDLGDVDLF